MDYNERMHKKAFRYLHVWPALQNKEFYQVVAVHIGHFT